MKKWPVINKWLAWFLTLSGIITVSWLIQSREELPSLIFCDVGQGDAILIIQNSYQILIDGGKDDLVLKCLEKYIPPWDKALDMVVTTHPDLDHIGGLSFVLDQYQVKYLLLNPLTKDTADVINFKNKVNQAQEQGTQVLQPFLGQTITWGEGRTLTVLSPQVELNTTKPKTNHETELLLSDINQEENEDKVNYNDRSIVLLLQLLDMSVLLTGDLELVGEQAMISQGLIPDVDILKVGHHGSKTSTSLPFLELNRPEYSVISAGKKNSYGHPAQSILDLLKKKNILVYRTDQQGDIQVKTNGKHFWFEPKILQYVKEQNETSK